MAQRKRKETAPLDLAQLKRGLVEELSREGFVRVSAIKPKGLREELVASLREDGWEVTKTSVRRGLAEQLDEALAHGAIVPVKSLAAHVRGASAPELKALVTAAVQRGKAHKVLRGSAETLAGPSTKVLSRQQLEALQAQLDGLAKALKKVRKVGHLTMSTDDVASSLSTAQLMVTEPAPAPAPAPTRRGDAQLGAVLDAVDAVRDDKTGLSFVPRVVGKLSPPLDSTSVVRLLLDAASRELLELRPEGGLGRLSEAELSVCPRGPHGTRLSWARRLEGGVR